MMVELQQSVPWWDGRKNEYIDGRMGGWKNGWMEECMMGGPIDDTNGRQTDRWKDVTYRCTES